MKKREITKLVYQFDGWWEKDVARFPTPHQKAEFEKELARLEAGVSEAGVSAPAIAGIGDCRREANKLLIELLTFKTTDRNNFLESARTQISVIYAGKRAKALQSEIDALLWMMTCCGLVEIDDEARRIAACPEHLKSTLSEVLGTR